MIEIISHKKIRNGACDEVIFKEGDVTYTAVLSPNSGIVQKENGEFMIIDEMTRRQIIDKIA